MQRATLNHTYRVIWSAVQSAFVAVAENVRGKGKSASASSTSETQPKVALSSSRYPNPSLLALALMLSGTVHAADLPTGGEIVAGSGNISQSGNVMTVTQGSGKMATNWQSFSIGANHTVNFVQPSASAIALNRVLGSDVSVIQGALNANGKVFLVNPNGVLFTPTAQVNVGGLIASTLNISNDNFMAGTFNFTGISSNAIINQANIIAVNGGSVVLIAAKVINEGSIVATAGNVLIAAGTDVTLDMGGPVKIQVNAGAIDALIHNGGAIKADGGLIYLTAKAANDLASTVINNTGLIEAQTLATGKQGEIYLMGDMENDSITVGGTINASAPVGGNGGFIETSAANVQIADNVNVTTSAANGETGTWLIDPVDFYISASGGNIKGSQLNTLLNTNSITIKTTTGTNTNTNLFGTAGDKGDIYVNDAVMWSINTLTLSAHRNIYINAALTGMRLPRKTDAKLVFEYGQGAVKSGNTAFYAAGLTGSIRLPTGDNFSTKLGSDGATVVTQINAAGVGGGAGSPLTAANSGTAGQTMINNQLAADAAEAAAQAAAEAAAQAAAEAAAQAAAEAAAQAAAEAAAQAAAEAAAQAAAEAAAQAAAEAAAQAAAEAAAQNPGSGTGSNTGSGGNTGGNTGTEVVDTGTGTTPTTDPTLSPTPDLAPTASTNQQNATTDAQLQTASVVERTVIQNDSSGLRYVSLDDAPTAAGNSNAASNADEDKKPAKIKVKREVVINYFGSGVSLPE